jgi:ribosome-associated toxin RatA of RatAB toxin-antitoxin module
MGNVKGSASVEIEAPIEAVYAVAADVEGSTRWQPELSAAECLERDRKGDQVLNRMETGGVKKMRFDLRFSFEPPTRISWFREAGDMKSIEGEWEFEDLGDGRTRATYRTEVDLGRRMGLVVRGPILDMLRANLVESMPGKLKTFVEGDGAG